MLLAYFNDINYRDIHYKQKNIEKSTLYVVRQPIDIFYGNITAHKEFMTSEENHVNLYYSTCRRYSEVYHSYIREKYRRVYKGKKKTVLPETKNIFFLYSYDYKICRKIVYRTAFRTWKLSMDPAPDPDTSNNGCGSADRCPIWI